MLELLFALLLIAILGWLVSRRSHLRLRVRLELLLTVATLMTAAAYIVVKRFQVGLGGISHMTDQFPWGIWIAFDLCGVALAAGGFVLAATIHVFHLRRFEPVLRPVVLTALISYQLVAAILVLDLGRPYRFWHPLIMWQPHSVMFEITFCLTLYTLVLLFECSPPLFERLHWPRAAAAAHELALPVVILGVILSTLHQSSFGSLFLIVPTKLSALWYTPLLPIMFFVSAVCGGIAVVMLESHWCARWLGRGLPDALLVGLGRACAWVLWLVVALKVGDLLWRHAWRAGLAWPWLGLSWIVEVGLGAVLPAVWLGRLRPQRPARGLTAAPTFVVCGVVLNRLNVAWFGLIPGTGYAYVPSWMEVLLTAAFVVLGMLAFVGLVQALPIFPDRPGTVAHAPVH